MSDLTGPAYKNAAPHNASMVRLQLALERELRSDETLIWHGWQLDRLERGAFAFYIFAIPWTAFSVMWTVLAAGAIMNSGEDGPGWIGWAFPLFGLPFVAIGLAMLARPFTPWFQHGRMLYVVTDRRVLKLGMGRELVVDAAPANRIGLIQRHEQRDGTGKLRLAIAIGKDSDGDRQTEFFEIGHVADVMGAQAAIDQMTMPTAKTDRTAAGQASSLSS